MVTKRAAESDPEDNGDQDEDQVMNGEHSAEDEADENNINGLDDGDGDAEMESGEDEEGSGDEIEMEPSPSPVKKQGIATRSGLRKRRRSLNTTGLTPPGTVNKAKKARKSTTVKKASPSSTAAAAVAEAVPKNGDTKAVSASPIMPDPRRISYSVAPSLPSNILEEPPEEDDSSEHKEEIKEIDVVPPKVAVHTNGTKASTDHVETTADVAGQQQEQHVAVASQEETATSSTGEAEKGYEGETPVEADPTEDIPKTGLSRIERLVIFFLFGFLSLLITMPLVIRLTQIAVPLDASILPPATRPSTKVDEEEEDEVLEAWNTQFATDLEGLLKAKKEYSSLAQDFADYYDELTDRIAEMRGELKSRRKVVVEKLNNLTYLEEAMEDSDDSWEQVKDLVKEILGKTMLTTSSISLWDVPKKIDTDCDVDNNDDDYLNSEDDDDDDDDDYLNAEDDDEYDDGYGKLLSSKLLQEKESALMLRSTITAEKFIGGAVAEERVRSWVQSQITKLVQGNEEVTDTLEDIQKLTKDLTKLAARNKAENNGGVTSTGVVDQLLNDIIQSRLDVHRADTTGIFDHAALKNGAEIIYGGKRGTSKSLVDDLPIVNRVLQTSNLRFYGFGPEAALTPTYPASTLGQCWSFQETPLKEQLKDRELHEKDMKVPNDFKRGNFGTLTIRLPSPIVVKSIVIEHSPAHLTDEADSAIRSFRVVGYEDEMASSKAWNLGSFEYSLKDNRSKNEYLQEFEVANTVFGKEIPPLYSISLAVDSNYGNEYACLYRFRVHASKD